MSINSEDQANITTLRLFTRGETLSMFISVEGALLSGAATAFLLSYKAFFTIRKLLRNRHAVQLVQTPSDACDSTLFLSLLAGELLRSVGASMTLRWVLEETITDDNFCRAQGYLKLIGTNAIDFSTLGITIHTFTVLVLRWTQPRFRHMAKYLTVGVWVVVVLITSISHAIHPKDLMGPTGYWCWIKASKVVGIMAEYLWMWIIGVITAVLYGVGFVVLRPNRGPNANDDDDVREMRRIANELLWYPVVYLVCITPQSFGRWFSFSGYDVPYQFTLFARTLFSLSGVFNAILFFNTRYHLLNGGPSTEAINAAPPSEHDTTNSVTAGGPAMRETVPLTRFPTSDSHILNLERRGESSTARAAQTGVRRVPRVDDEEVDLGLAPP